MPEIIGESTGGSDILSYNLQYNGGDPSTNFISVIGFVPDSLIRTISKGGLTTNVVYSFRYQIRNKYGWSTGFSPIVQVRAATIPNQVPSMTFNIQDMTKVRVGWVQPYNGGSPITSYNIQFLN